MSEKMKMQITIKSHGNTFSGEISNESSINEAIEVFMGLLVASGYHHHTVEYGILQKAEEIKESEA